MNLPTRGVRRFSASRSGAVLVRVTAVTAVLSLAGIVIAQLALTQRVPPTNPPIPPRVANSVTSFASNHPEFAPLRDARSDASTLRFNHQVHLAGGSGIQKNLAEIVKSGTDAALRITRLGDGKLALSCLSCHEIEKSGQLILAVDYESHCIDCHKLEPPVIEAKWGSGSPVGGGDWTLPHGSVPEVIESIDLKLVSIELALLSEADRNPITEQPEEKKPTGRRRGGGGGDSGGDGDSIKNKEHISTFLDSKRAELLAWATDKSGCGYCHTTNDGASGSFDVLRPNVPDVWMPRAYFSHRAHNMMGCAECHAAPASTKTADILLPGIASCRECHNPQVDAPHDCVTCHTFHARTPDGGGGTRTINDLNRRGHSPSPAK